MRAIVQTGPGDVGVQGCEKPTLGAGEVLSETDRAWLTGRAFRDVASI